MEMLKGDHEMGKPIPNSEMVLDSVKSIVEMGFIGRMRHPLDMQRTENVIFGAMMTLAAGLEKGLRNSMISHFVSKAKVPNEIPLDFPKLSRSMVELMGETTYSIMLAPKNHYFLLPDCTTATKRFKMKDRVIDGQVFINPGMVVGLVIMPISSKMVLAATKTEFAPNQGNGTYILSEETLVSYNGTFFDNAIIEVACENKDYLKHFINSI